MARTPQDVTDAELAVLQALWEHGPLPIRRITEVLYPEGKTAQYATVQKLLERLETKGIKPFMPITEIRPGVRIAMVSDPDGNTVEFLQPS